jgi:hypothetical protein
MAAGVLSGALGQMADINATALATLSGGAWAPALPLSNIMANALATSPRHIGTPARCTFPGNLAASQLELTWDRNYAINLVGVMFHTLSLDARYRLSVAPLGGSLDAPDYVTDWQDVYGRLFDTSALPYEADNWWTGQLTQADIDLYPRHLWIPLFDDGGEFIVGSQIRIEFDDALNPAGWFDVGGLFTACSFTPQFNFDRGRQLGANDRSQSDTSPSGRRFPQVLRPERTQTVTWSFASREEAYAFYDMGIRAGTTRMVLFIPDIGDEVGMQREAFPATFTAYTAPRFIQDQQHVVSATLREIIA